MGLKPVIYEAGRIGGRLRSQPFEGADGVIAELGGMRFPVSSTGFYHYVDLARPDDEPVSQPAGAGHAHHRDRSRGRDASTSRSPRTCRRCSARSPTPGARRSRKARAFPSLQEAIRARDVDARSRRSGTRWCRIWDDRSFYDFVATSPAFASRSFRHREVFGQVGFGTGGWDSDFPNSMLEILRVVVTDCDEDQRFIVGGVEQVPRRLWRRAPERMVALAGGHLAREAARRRDPARASRGSRRAGDGRIAVTDRWGDTREYRRRARHLPDLAADHRTSNATKAVLATSCGWRSTAPATCSRPRPSSWSTGRSGRTATRPPAATVMSMTLTDRLTRGTYLFDNGDDQAGRHLPLLFLDERRAEDAAAAGRRAGASWCSTR